MTSAYADEREARLLDPAARAPAEQAFGRTFDGVRVHTGPHAAQVTRNAQARAVTVGADIAFAPGEYRPGTLEGDALIAHELAHVVQQEGAPPGPVRVEPERGPLESDAAMAALRTVAPRVGGGGAPGRAAPTERTRGLALQRCTSPGLKTSSGKFGVSSYTEVDEDPGKDSTKRCGAAIDLSFTPNDTVVSNKIGFVQMMKALRAGKPRLFPNEQRRATTAADKDEGWAVDRLAGMKSPHYGESNTGAGGSTMSFGSRTAGGAVTDATMNDRIALTRSPGETFDTTAATFALDIEHGTYLGALGWGYEVSSAGAVTKKALGVVETGAPTGIHRRALELWNDQAADPDPAKRNAPNQEKVPVP